MYLPLGSDRVQSATHSPKQVRVDVPFLRRYPHPLAVWWYGPIIKNTNSNSVPKVVVLFRRLDEGAGKNRWLRRETALTHLGLLRIGSVWQSACHKNVLPYQSVTFDVDYSPEGWTCLSAAEIADRAPESLWSTDLYPLEYRHDRNYLLDFKLADGRNLLVPCMEFFVRCFGHSAEVKRVLATYPWEEAERRLYLPFEEQPPHGTWAIKLAKRMRNDDVVFLAHVKYDRHARRVAKSIYSQAEAAPSPAVRGNPYVFLRAIPWFHGPAQLEVEGIPFNGGRSFLALRITGASQPNGNAVIRDRENRGGILGTDEVGGHSSDPRTRIKRARSFPGILDLTSDEEPDHGSMSADIEEDDFKILGTPRAVIDRKTAVERGFVRRVTDGTGIKSISTGERYGSGKGVGYGSIHAPIVLESEGALRETWKAARHLAEAYPEIVRTVGWYALDSGVNYDGEPKLVVLVPALDDKGKVKSTWVYREVETETPRGILIIAMEVSGIPVYLLEIQRRIVTATNGEQSEESFKGLAVTTRNGQDPCKWLRPLLGGIQAEKGVVQRVIGYCPEPTHAYAYKHVASTRENVALYETAVLNVLSKVGVIAPGEARRSAKP